MKHYLRSGASAYMYWNIATDMSGKSTWGWTQNALVSVDTAAKTLRYNHDYYLLKHLTHFVEVGARCVETTGTCDDAIAFVNPNGGLVVLLRNEQVIPQLVEVRFEDRSVAVELPPDSIGTVTIAKA